MGEKKKSAANDVRSYFGSSMIPSVSEYVTFKFSVWLLVKCET